MKSLRELKEFLLCLISSTQGKGPSSTRLVYLANGLGCLFCALVMTIGGIEVYCAKFKADPVYWTAVAALWTATLGFSTKAKSEQNRGSVQVATAPRHSPAAPAVASATMMVPAPVQGD